MSPAAGSSLSDIAVWLLDLGISAGEARQWATTDPGHPAASCLALIDAMEALAS
jgi:hypothetical protein